MHGAQECGGAVVGTGVRHAGRGICRQQEARSFQELSHI
jgi:hypothetical protein